MDIASLVIGIIAVVMGMIPCVNLFAIIPAVVGLILGAVSMVQKSKANEPKGKAIAGLVLNIVALLVTFGMYFFANLVSKT